MRLNLREMACGVECSHTITVRLTVNSLITVLYIHLLGYMFVE